MSWTAYPIGYPLLSYPAALFGVKLFRTNQSLRPRMNQELPRPVAISSAVAGHPAAERRTDAERLRMKAEQVRTVMRSSPRNLTTGILGAAVMAFVAWHGVDASPVTERSSLPWIWWLLTTAGLAPAALLGAWANKRALGQDEVMSVADSLMMIGVYCGFCWGLMPWMLMPALSVKTDAVLMIASAMVLMGGAASSAIYRPWLLRVLLPSSVGLCTGLVRFWEPFYFYMAIATAMLTFVIMAAARVQEQAVKASIQAGFDKEALLKELIQHQAVIEQARAEAETAREEAEVANQAKTTFLAAAGHDLRQPMHALVQYFAHLKRRNTDPTLEETISRFGSALDSMQDLLDTILEVSKLMMGTVRPQPRTFELTTVMDRIDAQMRPLAEDRGLRYETRAEHCEVTTDPVLLERIVRNLTLNAIRYTDHGYVVVRTRRRGQSVQLQVFDSGIGIPHDERSRIFEAFYQVGNQARDRRKGLGLGLAIVKQLSELLSIPVRLRSSAARGSVFTAELLVAASDEEQGVRDEAPDELDIADAAAGAFVVLIDDNSNSLHATATTLTEFGCRVLCATSGMEAIERLQGQEAVPHLVISDYRLDDGETGLDAISMVLENQRALYGDDLYIPSLVLSGDTAPSELERVSRAKIPMLHKPVSVEALHRAVNMQLMQLAAS